MKIKVADFIQQVEAGNYLEKNLPEISLSDINEQTIFTQDFKNLFEQFGRALAAKKLARIVQPLKLAGQQASVVLETGVINLPFANTKRVDNFFNLEAQTPLVVNLIVLSEQINASGLRIDTCGEVTDWGTNLATSLIRTTLKHDLLQILENSAQENAAK